VSATIGSPPAQALRRNAPTATATSETATPAERRHRHADERPPARAVGDDERTHAAPVVALGAVAEPYNYWQGTSNLRVDR
jgi:hypothetical protein